MIKSLDHSPCIIPWLHKKGQTRGFNCEDKSFIVSWQSQGCDSVIAAWPILLLFLISSVFLSPPQLSTVKLKQTALLVKYTHILVYIDLSSSWLQVFKFEFYFSEQPEFYVSLLCIPQCLSLLFLLLTEKYFWNLLMAFCIF